MKVALGRTLTATPVDRETALEARVTRVESQQLAELDRVDHLEQELANAITCAAQQLNRIRSLEGALERIERDQREDELEGSPQETKFYGVHAGRKPGVYMSWKEARREVDGFANSRHQRFSDYMSANVCSGVRSYWRGDLQVRILWGS